MEICSEIIKEIMNTHNLSQQALADRLNLGQKTISDWILGKTLPNAKSLIQIHNEFGITPNEILGIEGNAKIYNDIHQKNLFNNTEKTNQQR